MKLAVEQARGGDVDRHGQSWPRGPPFGALFEGLVEHHRGERAHQPGLFGERQELQRRNIPKPWVRPADQGLDRHDLPGGEVDLGLVVQLELALLDRRLELLGETHAVAAPIEVLLVDGEVLATDLRAIHGNVGAAQQVLGVRRVAGNEGDADAGADPGPDRGEDERLLEPRRQPLGDRRGEVGVGVHQHHTELVAAEADEQVGVSQRSLQAGAELTQELIAGGMAERVVDLLEAVEVDVQERHGALADLRVSQKTDSRSTAPTTEKPAAPKPSESPPAPQKRSIASMERDHTAVARRRYSTKQRPRIR